MNRKKRILFCTEATSLNTGYAGYSREILSYLHSTNKYEIAELGAYAPRDAQSEFPWTFFGNMPLDSDSDDAKKIYQSSTSNTFGEYRFAEACLSFLPDIVCDIRDFWMMEFQQRSAFRPFYHWVIMPTVDAAPQAQNWLMTYNEAEACLSYSDWAGEVLENAGISNYKGSAPPSAHRGLTFQYENKDTLKSEYSTLKDKFVIGTVMRNQRRKLYPDLFEAFSKFLSKVDDPSKYVLYCHTSFPDMGWDIPEILMDNEISNNVVFTYVCQETKKVFPHPFAGPTVPSPFVKDSLAAMSNVKAGVTIEQFNKIYGLFDLYVQYANSEGFGLPQVEAAACGVPVMSVDYSAMTSVIRKLGGVPLKPKSLYKEMETGCMRAVPDNDYTAEKFEQFFKMSQEGRNELSKKTYDNFQKFFKWEESGKQWEKIFDELPLRNWSETWMSKPKILSPDGPVQNWKQYKIHDLVEHLFSHVLCDPSKTKAYIYQRMMRDLRYGYAYNPNPLTYENDASFNTAVTTPDRFDYQKAYEICYNLRLQANKLEEKRGEILLNRIHPERLGEFE